MKNAIKILLFALCAIAAGCKKDGTGSGTPSVTTLYVRDVFYNEVLAQADLENGGSIVETGFLVSPAAGVDPSTATIVVQSDSLVGKRFKAYVGGLDINTDYWLRPYAKDAKGNYYLGFEITFRTAATRVEYVTLKAVDPGYDNVTSVSAMIYGSVTDLGGTGQAVQEYGAWYWPDGDPANVTKVAVTVAPDKPVLINTTLAVPVTGLQPNTTYNVQFYARNARKPQFLDPVTITTEDLVAPAIEWGSPLTLTATATSVSANLTVTSNGYDPDARYGVYWGTSADNLPNKVYMDNIDAGGNFVATVKGLSVLTDYWLKGFVENRKFEATTSDVQTIRTEDYSEPRLEAFAADYTDLTARTAVLRAKFTTTGGSDLTSYGFRYGTDPGALTQTAQSADLSAETFSATLDGLTPGTTYYYNAFAVNGFGEGTGATVQSFRTGVEGELQWVFNPSAPGAAINNDKIVPGTTRMIYFDLPPVAVTIDNLLDGTSKAAKLYFLDRNLGANERYPNCTDDMDDAGWARFGGYYFKWGNRKPDFVYQGTSAGTYAAGAPNAQTNGWRNDPTSAPTDQLSWPAASDPCPAGYHVPTLFEWQAFSQACAAGGSGNGNFQDVYNVLYQGKTGYRQQTGAVGVENTIDGVGSNPAQKFLGYLWSSTALISRPKESLSIYNIVSGAPSTVTFDNTGSTMAYHFGVTTNIWVLPAVGNSFMVDNTAGTGYTDPKFYDSWMFYGINIRDERAGMPVRCVRTEYE